MGNLQIVQKKIPNMNKIIKKKLIISSYDDQKNPVYSGGGAYVVHQLARNLVKKYEVTVITSTYQKAKSETIDGIKYIRTGSDIFGHKIGQLIFQYSLLKYALKNKYDIWIESTTPPFTFSLLPLFFKKPVVSWVNMLCSFDMQRKYKLNLRPIERELCKLYKYIIVPTDWVKKEIKIMNKNAKTLTMAPTIEQERHRKPIKKMRELDNYILFIGRIEINQKGLDLLLQAMSLTVKKIQLVIAGSGFRQEQKKLHYLIKKYDLERKVRVIGRVNGLKKEAVFKYSKAVVIPSRFETFSLTAMESILHQKPIICFNIPQLDWIPEKFALKITPFKLKKLAKAIDKIYSDKTTKRIFAHDKKEFLKNYNWKKNTQEFLKYISRIPL